MQRGVKLVVSSLELMRSQPGLLAVPVVAAGAAGVVLLVAALIGSALPSGLALVLWILAFGVIATISVTGQAVIAHRVMGIISGTVSTNRQSLDALRPRISTIAAWAVTSMSVGALIRSFERGRGPFGLISRLTGAFFMLAWSAATFFVLPVIVFEGLALRPAITRSRQLVAACWGEGLIGIGVLSLLVNLTWVGVILLCVLLAAAHLAILTVPVLLLAVIAINLAVAVANPVLHVALYHYAITGQTALGITTDDLAGVFTPRRRRTGLPANP